MSLIEVTRCKKLGSTSYHFGGFYFKNWFIQESKKGFTIYNDVNGDSATISASFLNEFYEGDFLKFVNHSLRELPPLKVTTDPILQAKIDRFSDAYFRFKKEIKTAFHLCNYSMICLFEQELPAKLPKNKA